MTFPEHLTLKTFTLLLAFVFGISTILSCNRTVPAEQPIVVVEVTPMESPVGEDAVVTLPDCIDFQELIDETYDFKPSKLSESQKTAKSAEMDVVWEKVKADQKRLVPCLIAALNAKTANSFFRFDGSTLLFSHDKSESSKKLLIESYSKSEIEDVDPRNWIAYILKFGLDGLDTSAAGDTWLRAKDPRYYLPQHGTLPVDKSVGALAIYGSMDEQFASPALLGIAEQVEHPGREIAVDLLTKLVTDEAFEGLARLDSAALSERSRSVIKKALVDPTFIEKRSGTPKISRAEYLKAFKDMSDGNPSTFMDLTVKAPDGEKDAVAVLQKGDVPLIRKARRVFASTGTPHAPEWYQSFTDILMFILRKEQDSK